MKRCAVSHIALCVLVVAASSVLGIVGCGSPSPVGTSASVPVDFVYAGNRYICTGVVANQDIDAGTPSNVIYIGSTSDQLGERDVYLIQGVEKTRQLHSRLEGPVGIRITGTKECMGKKNPLSLCTKAETMESPARSSPFKSRCCFRGARDCQLSLVQSSTKAPLTMSTLFKALMKIRQSH